MVASTTGAGATITLRLADQRSIFGLIANAMAITTSVTSARLPASVTPYGCGPQLARHVRYRQAQTRSLCTLE